MEALMIKVVHCQFHLSALEAPKVYVNSPLGGILELKCILSLYFATSYRIQIFYWKGKTISTIPNTLFDGSESNPVATSIVCWHSTFSSPARQKAWTFFHRSIAFTIDIGKKTVRIGTLMAILRNFCFIMVKIVSVRQKLQRFFAALY